MADEITCRFHHLTPNAYCNKLHNKGDETRIQRRRYVQDEAETVDVSRMSPSAEESTAATMLMPFEFT